MSLELIVGEELGEIKVEQGDLKVVVKEKKFDEFNQTYYNGLITLNDEEVGYFEKLHINNPLLRERFGSNASLNVLYFESDRYDNTGKGFGTNSLKVFCEFTAKNQLNNFLLTNIYYDTIEAFNKIGEVLLKDGYAKSQEFIDFIECDDYSFVNSYCWGF
jgi:hypothetical protein